MLADRLLNEIPGVTSVRPQGRALLLPAARPRGLRDRRRREVRHRPAARQEDPGHPRHRLQLARARPLPAGDAARRRGARGGDRPDRRVPRHPTLTARTEEPRARPHLPADHRSPQDRLPAARPADRHDRHRARAAHRRRAARRQPHRLRRLRLRRPGRQPVGPQGAVHVQAGALRPPLDRPADALAAPHRGRPRRRARRRTATALEYLRAGEAVGIFPEATISRAMELKEFKTGAVRIAAAAGVPLVPVVLWGTQRMMTKDHPRDFSRGKTIAIRVGEPLHPTGADPVAETAELHARDVAAARRGDRGLPRRRAAARLLVAPGVVRRQRAHPGRGGPARRRGAGGAGRPAARDAARSSRR